MSDSYEFSADSWVVTYDRVFPADPSEIDRVVESVMAITGFGFGGRGQNSGIAFVKLKHWDKRKAARLSANAVSGRAMRYFSQIKEATVFAFSPPAISELCNVAGFQMQLQDRAGLGHEALANAIRHGCKNDSSKQVQCTVACDEHQGMLVVVRDSGEGFDPSTVPSPLIGENVFHQGAQ